LLLWLISAPSNYTDLKLGLACVFIMGLFCGFLAGWKREKFWENAVNWLFMWG
jgi:ABC-type dipeptide/oligopeptide/nickel transport system permease component